MKVFVLGYKGMLGRYVYSYLKDKNYTVIGLTRSEIDAADPNAIIHAPLFAYGAKENDVIINCMGTIKPQVDKHGTVNAIKVNSLFPHKLASICERDNYKLIHITTDCVFSGNDGNYDEDSPHDCIDVYGKTKSLGEPENCTIIRTSIIGEESGTSRSLIEWVKSQDGKSVNGYVNHQWNGLTCHQVAIIFEDIIRNDSYWRGVRHLFSPKSMNKFELVSSIIKAHDLNIQITPTDGPTKCDRTLSTKHPTNDEFKIPDILSQLEEQYFNVPKF